MFSTHSSYINNTPNRSTCMFSKAGSCSSDQVLASICDGHIELLFGVRPKTFIKFDGHNTRSTRIALVKTTINNIVIPWFQNSDGTFDELAMCAFISEKANKSNYNELEIAVKNAYLGRSCITESASPIAGNYYPVLTQNGTFTLRGSDLPPIIAALVSLMPTGEVSIDDGQIKLAETTLPTLIAQVGDTGLIEFVEINKHLIGRWDNETRTKDICTIVTPLIVSGLTIKTVHTDQLVIRNRAGC